MDRTEKLFKWFRSLYLGRFPCDITPEWIALVDSLTDEELRDGCKEYKALFDRVGCFQEGHCYPYEFEAWCGVLHINK